MLTPAVDMRELRQIWRAALGCLELQVSRHGFATWLEGTRAVAFQDATIVVEAHNSFSSDWLNERLLPVVERALREVTGDEVGVLFVPRGAGETVPEALCLARAPGLEKRVLGQINGAFTIDRYIQARGNEVALAGAMACLGEGDPAMDPLVVVGDPGLGKTHLIHAIAGLAAGAGAVVACLTAGDFTRRFVNAVTRRENALHDELGAVQLLAFDDLQVLQGKDRTAEAFADVIDAVANGGGHVLVTSEADPQELALPHRLQSRLRQGLTVRVEPFAAPERRCFVLAHAGRHGVELPDWAVERLSAASFTSVRDLQGVCNSAIAMLRAGHLGLEQLDTEIVRRALPSGPGGRRGALELLALVAEAFETTPEDLAGRSRASRVADARAAAVAVLRSNGHSFPEIGRLLAGRDRSTVLGLSVRGQAIAESHPRVRPLLAG